MEKEYTGGGSREEGEGDQVREKKLEMKLEEN